MSSQYKIHPAIGIARVGNSENDFYLAPESAGALPIQCDDWGNEKLGSDGKTPLRVENFKNGNSELKRQAARFKIYVYDEDSPEGRELKIGDDIQGIGSHGKLVDIQWTAYLANKKSVWYQFQQLEGEHGYSPDHPLRNADITDPKARQKLIIDPGPQTIVGKRSSAEFARGKNPTYAQTFPPPLEPYSIDTLGEIRTNDDHNLIVLGGHGRSGSFKTGFSEPRISFYCNNPGWFDDISDGPVTALLVYWDELDEQYRYQAVEDPSWVIVGYPAYAPEIEDMVSIDEVVYDVAVRNFAFDPYLYGTDNFDNPTPVPPQDLPQWRNAQKAYNANYYPYFYRDIWPVLSRPNNMQWVTTELAQSNYPHSTGYQGNFYEEALATPPSGGEDPHKPMRQKIYDTLRQKGQENVFSLTGDPTNFQNLKPLMPLLLGDNPLTNTLPSKFLRLTDTTLFLLKQWMEGKFINEKMAGIDTNMLEEAKDPGMKLTHGVLSNVLGGAFNPGAEVAWIIRNPMIFSKAYRIHANENFLPTMETSNVRTTPGITIYERSSLSQNAPLSAGLEPGDLTKYSALPWQADFNECSNETVDITYEEWNKIYDAPTDGKAHSTSNQRTYTGLWWPSHRPMQVFLPTSQLPVAWAAGIPQNTALNHAGDFKMVTNWNDLGIIKSAHDSKGDLTGYFQQERNNDALGSQLPPEANLPNPPKPKKKK